MILAARIFTAFLAVSALVGCGSSTSMPATAASGGDEPANFQLVSDIPIMSGATRDNDRSVILSYRDRWVGKLVMKVWKTAGESAGFYQQQMPNFGWEPVMSVTSQRSIMTYLRGDRAATLEIESSTLWGATVVITVGPRETTGLGADMPAARPAPAARIRSESLPGRR